VKTLTINVMPQVFKLPLLALEKQQIRGKLKLSPKEAEPVKALTINVTPQV
jgi:hypothetical protein